MTIFRNFNYANTDITAMASDRNGGNFIWLAFKQDGNGNCKLMKVSANDPSQVYFDVDFALQEIKKIVIATEGASNSILIGIDDPTNYIYRWPTTNITTNPIIATKPAGINEAPIDVIEANGFLWWLFPGDTSGENAKIVKTTITFAQFQETIDLQQSGDVVRNARSLTYDSDSNSYWVATYTDPIELWRVFQDSGGIWTLQKNVIV